MNKNFISHYNKISQLIKLEENEEKYWSENCQNNLPFKITSYWLEQIKKEKGTIFRKQAIPLVSELQTDDHELMDPLGDNRHSPLEGLVHHYNDRVLILITDQCALYCRHCFRRHHTGNRGSLNFEQIDQIIEYLEKNDEVHEVIISGGDALFAPLEILSYLLKALNSLSLSRVVRLATRLPITAPHLIDNRRLKILKNYPGLWLVTQINHPCEITEQVVTALQKIQKTGIPVLNQSVLLKGINDSTQILKELCYKLIEHRVKPYYLFQCDLAMGTKHFRVPLDRALTIYADLKRQISHMALPRFALDLPGGEGKVNLDDKGALSGIDNGYYYFTTVTGKKGRYPREVNKDE